jgi:hypothetical protein
MRLLLATESERLANVRLAAGSENDAARSNVVTMRRRVEGEREREGKGQSVDEGLRECQQTVTLDTPNSGLLKSSRVRHVIPSALS